MIPTTRHPRKCKTIRTVKSLPAGWRQGGKEERREKDKQVQHREFVPWETILYDIVMVDKRPNTFAHRTVQHRMNPNKNYVFI